MQLIISRDTGMVTINGTTHKVDCSDMQPEIVTVRWFDDHGELHYRDGRVTGLGDVFRFKSIIDRWHDAQQATRNVR